jgi:Spherulation-specific family 4
MPKIAVPAYFWPGGYWDNLISAAGPVKIAVVNIDSGPGWAKEPAFAATFDRARAAGVELVGYTYTSYGRRPSADVLADAKKYRDWYGITSVFLDETPEQCGSLAYYDNIYKTLHPFGGRVIINPGQSVDECYVSTADTIVNFEGHVNDYLGWNPASWVQRYPSNKFWHIVYAAQTPNLTPALNKAREANSGYLYLTDDIMPNPFDRLPDNVMWAPVVSAANDQTTGSSVVVQSTSPSSTTRPPVAIVTAPPTTRLGVRSSATLPHSDSVNTTIVHRNVGTDNEDAKIAHIEGSEATDPTIATAGPSVPSEDAVPQITSPSGAPTTSPAADSTSTSASIASQAPSIAPSIAPSSSSSSVPTSAPTSVPPATEKIQPIVASNVPATQPSFPASSAPGSSPVPSPPVAEPVAPAPVATIPPTTVPAIPAPTTSSPLVSTPTTPTTIAAIIVVAGPDSALALPTATTPSTPSTAPSTGPSESAPAVDATVPGATATGSSSKATPNAALGSPRATPTTLPSVAPVSAAPRAKDAATSQPPKQRSARAAALRNRKANRTLKSQR